jgi:hypothetical protein
MHLRAEGSGAQYRLVESAHMVSLIDWRSQIEMRCLVMLPPSARMKFL